MARKKKAAVKSVMFSISLDEPTLDRIEVLAEAKRVKRVHIIRWAIDDYLASVASSDTIDQMNHSVEEVTA